MNIIPDKLKKCLDKDASIAGVTMYIIEKITPLLETEIMFFPEYTDHGVRHVQLVLSLCEKFIHKTTLRLLSAEDICVLVLSVFFHDISMHIGYEQFITMISAEPGETGVPWKHLWDEYFKEVRHYNEDQMREVFGRKLTVIEEIPHSKLKLNYEHKLLVGEFLRRYHHQLSYDIVLNGVSDTNGTYFNVFHEISERSERFKMLQQLTALAVRSHCESLWSSVSELEVKYGRRSIDLIHNVHIVYIMTVLRMADYFDISDRRAPKEVGEMKNFVSSVSKKEWAINQCVQDIRFDLNDDPEAIYIRFSTPASSEVYLGIQLMLKNMQIELDICWGVLGYLYSNPKEKLLLSYRRILTNFYEQEMASQVNFVPEEIKLRANRKLLHLLIGPLYNYNCSFAVREMIQNSVDACVEKQFLCDKNDEDYVPEITLQLIHNKKGKYSKFIIEDNGIGMNKNIIINYFLVAGGSYKSDVNWKKLFNEKGTNQIARIGQFGIGVLSSFMLGTFIQVQTQYYKSDIRYSFVTSLNNEQIDINVQNARKKESGTKICIEIDEKIYEQLSNNLYQEKYNWSQWYQCETPRLNIIKVNNNKMCPLDDRCYFPLEECRKIDNKSTEIYWKYGAGDVFYNRILIPQTRGPKYKGLKRIDLFILDTENKLNLSLDRTTIEYEEIMNEIELDMCKDYISNILQSDRNYSYEGEKYKVIEIMGNIKLHKSDSRNTEEGEMRSGINASRDELNPVFFNSTGQIHIGLAEKNFLKNAKLLVIYGTLKEEDVKKMCEKKYFINIVESQKEKQAISVYPPYFAYNGRKFRVETYNGSMFKKYIGKNSGIEVIQEIKLLTGHTEWNERDSYYFENSLLLSATFISLYEKYFQGSCRNIIGWDGEYRESLRNSIESETLNELN